jgi:hypothetical protein
MARDKPSTGVGGDEGKEEYSYLSGVEPTLKQDGTEITPLATIRLGGTIPWDTSSKQLQCGESITDNSGEQTHRLNMEAVVNHEQFKVLNQMRNNDTQLTLVSAGYDGPATFDQLKWDRIEDANGALTPNGAEDAPLYTVQLQTKENEDG